MLTLGVMTIIVWQGISNQSSFSNVSGSDLSHEHFVEQSHTQ